jgi:hypothetical protein
MDQAILRPKPQAVSMTPWLEVVSAAEVTEGGRRYLRHQGYVLLAASFIRIFLRT